MPKQLDTPPDKRRLDVLIPQTLHRELRIAREARDVTMGQLVTELLTAALGDPSGALDPKGLRPATPVPAPPSSIAHHDGLVDDPGPAEITGDLGFAPARPGVAESAAKAPTVETALAEVEQAGQSLAAMRSSAQAAFSPAAGHSDDDAGYSHSDCVHAKTKAIAGGLRRCEECGQVRTTDGRWVDPA